MIVDPDFLTHWKTQALTEALDNDTAAPSYVIALWAHCQLRRTDRFEGISHGTFAKICRYPFKGDSGAFFEAMKECGFVDIEGDMIIAHGWAEANAKLITSWQNGKLGGRSVNPTGTQQEPKKQKVELGTLEKRREDRRREEEIYEAYPLKRAKPDALRAIGKAATKHPHAFLLSQTQAYAAARNGDMSYVPNPATWFNQERFNDDPSTWKSGKNGKHEPEKPPVPAGHFRDDKGKVWKNV